METRCRYQITEFTQQLEEYDSDNNLIQMSKKNHSINYFKIYFLETCIFF